MVRRVKYYSLREVRRAGKKDGRNWRWKFLPPSWPFWESKDPDPPVAQKEPSQYEANLISVAHQNLERIGHEWSREEEKLIKEYCNAKAKKEELEQRLIDETAGHQEAIVTFVKAKEDFLKYSPRWIPLWLYWLIFISITFGEGVFNYFVFQIFGEEEWKTWIMAGAIILVIPLASELIGHHLKKAAKSIADKLWISLNATIVIALLTGIAILRETFFEASEYIKVPINPTTLTGILILLNLGIFVVLTYLSYTEARGNPEEYRKVRKAYEEASMAVKRESGDMERVAEDLSEAKDGFNEAHSARKHTFEGYKHQAEGERDGWASYIRTYRHANKSVRKNKTEPDSFNVDPETFIKIPPVFETLDWSCPGDKERGGK